MRWSTWRWVLCVAAVSPAVLLVVERQWLLAPLAVVCAVLIVGGWTGASIGGQPAAIVVGAYLAVVLLGLAAFSRWPYHPLRPPAADWLIGWLVIGGNACVVALVADRVRHRRLVDTARTQRWGIVVTIVAARLVLGCGYSLVSFSQDGNLRFNARADEVAPLPATLRLVSIDRCPTGGGTSGNCTVLFSVGSADGTTRAVAVERIAEHLRGIGWDLRRDGSIYHACRSIGGILPWTPHCLWFHVDADRHHPTMGDPDLVTIYVDNF